VRGRSVWNGIQDGSPAGIQGTTGLSMAGLEWVFNHNTGLDDPDADVPGHRPTRS